jgi:Domain of unknown function (DUF4838)
MKTILTVLCCVLLSGQAMAAQNPAWKRGTYQAAYALAKPWESKGITPVTMKSKAGLKPLVLADKGRALLPIVIPADSKYYADIAATLKEFLNGATGASFAVVTDRTAPARGIFVGPCKQPDVARVMAKVNKLPPEHFIVDCFAGGVILAGRDLDYLYEKARGEIQTGNVFQSRGTYFAVLDFLERFIGVRFYKPGALGTVVPYLNDRVVAFPPVTYADGPAFKSRHSSYGSYLTQDNKLLGYTKRTGKVWMGRMRCADVYKLKSGHTDVAWDGVYAKTNPEYFALREDGSRMVGARGRHTSQRCYTNEGGLQEHLRVIERFYKTGKGGKLLRYLPNKKYIYWWPNDGYRGCACPGCTKLTDKGAPSDRKHSRLIWAYVAKLARGIKQRWPDKVLVAPLYATWYYVPDGFAMPDNVRLMATWNHLPEGFLKEPRYWDFIAKDIERNDRFSCEPVIIWSHYPHKPRIGNGLNTPYPAPHVLKRLLVANRDKLSGVYLNGYACTSFALDGYILYVYKKMLWNPDLDVDACLEDYCRTLFGPAAGEVKAYLSKVIKQWETTRWKELPEGYHSLAQRVPWTNYYRETYPRDVRFALKTILSRARTQTKPGTVYNARTNYFVAATEPFFTQGKFLDRGGMTVAESKRFTPKIDGNLDEWAGIKPLVLKSNVTNKKAPVRTEVFIAYGPKAFYIAGRAEEPDALRVWKKGVPRDYALWRRDSFELFFCTPQPGMKEAGLNLAEQYYQIIVDPNGAIFDGYKSAKASRINAEVTVELECVAKPGAKGFVFEMAIPYTSLNTSAPKPGDHWLGNFYRNRPREGVRLSESFFAWSPTMRSAHDTSRFGRIEFPTKTLWTAELGSLSKAWNVLEKRPNVPIVKFAPGGHITITPTFEDGRMLLHIQADAKMPKPVELKFTSRKAKATFDGPVALDWKFRFKGKGLIRARHYAATPGNPTVLPSFFKPAQDSSGSDWINQLAVKPTKGELPSMHYYAFGLMIKPGADFVFEIDRIRVMARPPQ